MNTIVTLTGPSCSGKIALTAVLVKAGMHELIYTTSRRPLEGEIDGQHFHFINQEDFALYQRYQGFIESVKSVGSDSIYGLAVAEVNKAFEQGKIAVLVVAPAGCRQIARWAAKTGVQHLAVFVDTPLKVLLERFLQLVQKDRQTLLSTHVDRLLHLFQKESLWRFDYHWDLEVTDLNEFTCGATVTQIVAAAHALPLKMLQLA